MLVDGIEGYDGMKCMDKEDRCMRECMLRSLCVAKACIWHGLSVTGRSSRRNPQSPLPEWGEVMSLATTTTMTLCGNNNKMRIGEGARARAKEQTRRVWKARDEKSCYEEFEIKSGSLTSARSVRGKCYIAGTRRIESQFCPAHARTNPSICASFLTRMVTTSSQGRILVF